MTNNLWDYEEKALKGQGHFSSAEVLRDIASRAYGWQKVFELVANRIEELEEINEDLYNQLIELQEEEDKICQPTYKLHPTELVGKNDI